MKYTKKHILKHKRKQTRKRKYKQTHKRNVLKKRIRTRRKRGGLFEKLFGSPNNTKSKPQSYMASNSPLVAMQAADEMNIKQAVSSKEDKAQKKAAAKEAEKAWWNEPSTIEVIAILNEAVKAVEAVEAVEADEADEVVEMSKKLTINIVPSLREHGSGSWLGIRCDPGGGERQWNDTGEGMYEANNCAGYIGNDGRVFPNRNISTVEGQNKWIERMNGIENETMNYLNEEGPLPSFNFVLKEDMQMPESRGRRGSPKRRREIIREELLTHVFNSGKSNFIFVGHHNNMVDALFRALRSARLAIGNCSCIKVTINPTGVQKFVNIEVIYHGETDKYLNLLGGVRDGIFNQEDNEKENTEIIPQLEATWKVSLQRVSNGTETKNLYFIRHGQTLHNLGKGEFCTIGDTEINKKKYIDNPLTYKGQLQAIKCGEKLEDEFKLFTSENTAYYTTYLTRTTDTLFLILFTLAHLYKNQDLPQHTLWSEDYLNIYKYIVNKRSRFNRRRLLKLLDIDEKTYNNQNDCKFLTPINDAATTAATTAAATAATAATATTAATAAAAGAEKITTAAMILKDPKPQTI